MPFKELEPGIFVPTFRHRLQVYRIPATVHCEFPHIHEVSKIAKKRILSISRNTSKSVGRTLEELSRIDSWAASQFGCKDVAVRDFVMRLLYESSTQDALHRKDSSFVILSYTWHNSSWTPHHSLDRPSTYTQIGAALPLTPAMWSAFLLQRLSPSEGFWCDQLCIVQTSSREQHLAIGAMDVLYKSARKVVIALEDIAITKQEMDALVEFSEMNVDDNPSSHSDNRSQQQDRIASAFGRIVQARWFRRAWCLHEFLVSRNHTFLVPVSGEAWDGVVTIVRLDALFLNEMAYTFVKHEMTYTFVEREVEFKRFVERSLLASPDLTHEDLNRLHRFIMRLRALGMAKAFEGQLVRYTDVSYMHMFSEIFLLGAHVMLDKLSILLNVMNSGLYYSGSTKDSSLSVENSGSASITEEDCYHLATVVALACGDPTALTTNGGPVHSPNRKAGMQWLRLPSSADTMRPMCVRSLPKIGTDLAVTEKGLQLDMQFICTNAHAASAEYTYLSIARLLIDHRAMCKIPSSEPDLLLDMIIDSNDSYTGIRLYNIQALACALQLGADWICKVQLKLYANLPGADLTMGEGWKQDIEDAVDWALDMKIDEDLGPDMREIWEEKEQDDEERHSSNGILTAESAEEELIRYEEEDELSPEAHIWYWTLLRFADKLISAGLAVTTDDLSSRVAPHNGTDFAVQMLQLPNVDIPPFVVFAPACDQSADCPLNFCMPEVLANEVYWNISRLWILKECSADGSSRSFELVSKTRLIGSADVPEGERRAKVVIVG